MPELERWILHRLAELGVMRRREIDFHTIDRAAQFLRRRLSAFISTSQGRDLLRRCASWRRAARTVIAGFSS
jgi:hypothetical protein